jgi:hypothetical protein
MADVTPPGAGPTPLGRGVNPELIEAAAAAGSSWPGQVRNPIGLFKVHDETPTEPPTVPTPDQFQPGSILSVPTVAGMAAVTVVSSADDRRFMLTSDFGDVPRGTHVIFVRSADSLRLLVAPHDPFNRQAIAPQPTQRTLSPAEKVVAQADGTMMKLISEMTRFLNKGGPVADSHAEVQRQAQIKALALKLAILKEEARQPEAARPEEAPPVPDPPVRNGRAIELD